MAHDIARIIMALAAVALLAVTLMLALGWQSGLRVIGHRIESLPQAMLVRYGALTLLAALSAWLNLTDFLFAVLIVLAVIGLGDALIYRRQRYPFWLHVTVAAIATFGALLALFAKG